MKICFKCLTPQEDNIVKRKHKGKFTGGTTHQCKNCGSSTFYSGGDYEDVAKYIASLEPIEATGSALDHLATLEVIR